MTETMTETQLISLKQLPIIQEQLETVKKEIEAEIKTALSLVCTEDTYKEVKNVKAKLNAKKNDYETARKELKKAYMAEYERFNDIYETCITEPIDRGVRELTDKINSVTDAIKLEKENKIRAFYQEYAENMNIADIAPFEKSGIEVNMTVSEKKLKEQAAAFLDNVASGVQIIQVQEYAAEIMTEFTQSLDALSAIAIVTERHNRMKQFEKAQEEAPPEEETKPIEVSKPIEVVQAPTEVEDENIYQFKFTVYATKAQARELKNILNERGIRYE